MPLFYRIGVVIEDFWHITLVYNIVAKSRGGRQILDATLIAYVCMHARLQTSVLGLFASWTWRKPTPLQLGFPDTLALDDGERRERWSGSNFAFSQ